MAARCRRDQPPLPVAIDIGPQDGSLATRHVVYEAKAARAIVVTRDPQEYKGTAVLRGLLRTPMHVRRQVRQTLHAIPSSRAPASSQSDVN